jgi:hypothetical protein
MIGKFREMLRIRFGFEKWEGDSEKREIALRIFCLAFNYFKQ